MVEELCLSILDRLTNLDQRLDAVHVDLRDIVGRMDLILGQVDTVDGRLASMDVRLERIERRLGHRGALN